MKDSKRNPISVSLRPNLSQATKWARAFWALCAATVLIGLLVGYSINSNLISGSEIHATREVQYSALATADAR